MDLKTPLLPLTDGVERNRNHPHTFHIPSEDLRHGLKVGMTVKIGTEGQDPEPGGEPIHGEKFWSEVMEVRDADGQRRYIVRVDNDLVIEEHGLNYNDLVEVEPRHILATY